MAKKDKGQKEPQGPATIQNRRARYDYHIEDSMEAGIVLAGSEVKSVFLGRVNLTDAYCRVIHGELWLMNADIEPYTHSSVFTPERRRDRKLLAHKKEILNLERKAQEKGFALIPLKMYFKRGKAKVEVGLGRGKQQYDKRQQLQEKETRKEKERARSERY
ncbi:MAG: SsrA-binding protein SmpB [Armatimonadetes bacterium]|nr:SsrA-binding protein SmpB [Armatimonadota bacterium]